MQNVTKEDVEAFLLTKDFWKYEEEGEIARYMFYVNSSCSIKVTLSDSRLDAFLQNRHFYESNFNDLNIHWFANLVKKYQEK